MKLPEECPRCRSKQVQREDFSHAVPNGEQSSRVVYECGCVLTWERRAVSEFETFSRAYSVEGKK